MTTCPCRAYVTLPLYKDIMWEKLAVFIIRFRIKLVVLLAAITVFMAYKANDVEIT